MWGREADTSIVPVVLADDAKLVDVAAARGRALALALVALRGQGITQAEGFAFADAYEVWDHLTLPEHDFVLEPEPTGDELIQFAWCFERLWVVEWALNAVRYVGFPDMAVDTAKASEACIRQLATVSASELEFRPLKELLDLADVTRCCAAMGDGPVDRGIVIERARAFTELGIPC
jgi:Domain of unknown function (DUF4272)